MSIAEWHGIATRFRQLPVSFCLVISKSDTWEAKIRMTWEGKCWNQRKLPSCEASSERGCDMDRFRLLIWLYASSSAYASAHASACVHIYIPYMSEMMLRFSDSDHFRSTCRACRNRHMSSTWPQGFALSWLWRSLTRDLFGCENSDSARVMLLWLTLNVDTWLMAYCVCVYVYRMCIYIYTWYWLHYHYSYQLMVNLQPWK